MIIDDDMGPMDPIEPEGPPYTIENPVIKLENARGLLIADEGDTQYWLWHDFILDRSEKSILVRGGFKKEVFKDATHIKRR